MTTGLIIGKFMPLHRGHMVLIDYARSRVDRLTVLVCSLAREPIPGEVRYRWVRDLYPEANVQHLTDENPSYPEEHPDFWNIWTRSIRRFCPAGPDVVFTSELYGDKLAECLGARHEMVDLERKMFPVSGSVARERPLEYWDMLPPPVQAYFAEKLGVPGERVFATNDTNLHEFESNLRDNSR
ncbi:MAG: cytidyltransferase-related domain protein [Anaerolineales bacterium]|nr:cytidyltransferase-related domain protein [Anaerolineales bacterium]